MTETHWWTWATETDNLLRARGLDPKERWSHVAQRAPMPERWARTVGMWGLYASEDIRAIAGGTRSAFYVFKARHYLRTLAPKEPIPNPVQFAELVWGAVNPHAQEFELAAAAEIAAPEFGILPLEALLYWKAFEHVRTVYGFADLEPYGKMELRKRQLLWEECGALLLLNPPGHQHR